MPGIYSTHLLSGGSSFSTFGVNQGIVINASENSQPIPEPLTMLGASTAIAFGAAFKRRKAK